MKNTDNWTEHDETKKSIDQNKQTQKKLSQNLCHFFVNLYP